VLRRLPAGRNWPARGAATRPSSRPPFYPPPTVREHSLNDTAARPAAWALHSRWVCGWGCGRSTIPRFVPWWSTAKLGEAGRVLPPAPVWPWHELTARACLARESPAGADGRTRNSAMPGRPWP